MDTATYVIGWANNALLVTLSVLTILLARRTRTDTGRLLAYAVVTFTVATLTGWLPWAVGETQVHAWFAKFRLELQILFPYLLLRLAHAFHPFGPVLMRVATAALVAVMVFVAAFPRNIADPDIDLGAPIVTTLVLAYVGWVTVAMIATTVRFVTTGRGEPGTIRRRMYLLAGATVAMLLAYHTAFASWALQPYWMFIASLLLVAVSSIAYVAGVAPSTMMRLRWRREEEHELREAIAALLAAETRDDVLDGIIPKVRRIIGASAVGLVHLDGGIERVNGSTPQAELQLLDALAPRAVAVPGHQVTLVPFGTLQLAIRTTPATPLLGSGELDLLAWVGSVVELALARCDHLAKDRAVTDRLREVDKLKTEFVQIVAHDLRSPMTAVAGLAGTLNDRWEDIETSTKRVMVDQIGTSTQRMADLVVDVLDIARIDSGELHYDTAPFDMCRVVREAVDDLQLDAAMQRIHTHMPADVPLVQGDERRHRQVVANLLSNALKYSPQDEPIDVEVTPAEDEVIVGVRDHGAGIAPADQSRIFEKFGRAVSSTDATPGSGLGLYICKAMVEAQGGRIWVESVPGSGATFRFSVPVAGS